MFSPESGSQLGGRPLALEFLLAGDVFTKDQVRTRVAAGTPLRREGQASEVADAVAYLASDESSFLTGVNLDINGGMLFS